MSSGVIVIMYEEGYGAPFMEYYNSRVGDESESPCNYTELNNPNCNGRTTIIGGVLGDEMTSREIMKQLFT